MNVKKNFRMADIQKIIEEVRSIVNLNPPTPGWVPKKSGPGTSLQEMKEMHRRLIEYLFNLPHDAKQYFEIQEERMKVQSIIKELEELMGRVIFV